MRWLVFLLVAATLGAVELQEGAKIFLDEMSPEMEGYIASEVQKQGVPVVITRKLENAEFVLVGSSKIHKQGWKRALYGGKPDTGTASLYERESEELVWSATVGGRSFMKGDFKSGKRIAKKLVADLDKRYFKGKKK